MPDCTPHERVSLRCVTREPNCCRRRPPSSPANDAPLIGERPATRGRSAKEGDDKKAGGEASLFCLRPSLLDRSAPPAFHTATPAANIATWDAHPCRWVTVRLIGPSPPFHTLLANNRPLPPSIYLQPIYGNKQPRAQSRMEKRQRRTSGSLASRSPGPSWL
jgi:hypothetical protein